MQISYDKSIQKYFLDYSKMKKKIGEEFTKSVKKRIDQLSASDSFSDYLSFRIGKPHPLEGNLSECYGIHISANYRLVVEPIADDLSPESLKVCDSIEVKGVQDYHGKKYEWIIP